jgi:hypothetical protein
MTVISVLLPYRNTTTQIRKQTMSQYDGIYRQAIDSEQGVFELSSITAVNNKPSSPKYNKSIAMVSGHKFEVVVFSGDLEGIHYVSFSEQAESLIAKARHENKANIAGLSVEQISSIGWLNNHDGSICLSVCVNNSNATYFISISRKEFDDAGGREGLNDNKSIVIDFHVKYGFGRP